MFLVNRQNVKDYQFLAKPKSYLKLVLPSQINRTLQFDVRYLNMTFCVSIQPRHITNIFRHHKQIETAAENA